jgi:hypothetical protein
VRKPAYLTPAQFVILPQSLFIVLPSWVFLPSWGLLRLSVCFSPLVGLATENQTTTTAAGKDDPAPTTRRAHRENCSCWPCASRPLQLFSPVEFLPFFSLLASGRGGIRPARVSRHSPCLLSGNFLSSNFSPANSTTATLTMEQGGPYPAAAIALPSVLCFYPAKLTVSLFSQTIQRHAPPPRLGSALSPVPQQHRFTAPLPSPIWTRRLSQRRLDSIPASGFRANTTIIRKT